MPQPRRIALVAAAAVVAIAVVLAAFLVGNDRDDIDPLGPGTPIADSTGAIRVVVPASWTQIQTDPSRDGSVPRILAAPDAESYKTRRDAPGLEFLYTPDLDPEHVGRTLDEVATSSKAADVCDRSARRAFDHRGFKGSVDVHEGCGDAKAEVWVVAAKPPKADGLAVVSIQAATDAERDLILDSLAVTAGQ